MKNNRFKELNAIREHNMVSEQLADHINRLRIDVREKGISAEQFKKATGYSLYTGTNKTAPKKRRK